MIAISLLICTKTYAKLIQSQIQSEFSQCKKQVLVSAVERVI